MPHIVLENISLDFPFYHFGSRSLKKNIAGLVMGDRLDLNTDFVIVNALKDISFRVESGESVAIYGANGSGKTSLLKLLAGIYQPVSGNLSLDGKIGSLINVGAGIDHEASGWENIDLFLLLKGVDHSKRQEMRNNIANDSGLGEFLYLPVRNYSAGMHVRLTFAMELTQSPEILLMDEWISAGDEDFARFCSMRLNQLADNANIFLLATHNLDLIRARCSRVLVIDQGSLIDDLVVNEFFEKFIPKAS